MASQMNGHQYNTRMEGPSIHLNGGYTSSGTLLELVFFARFSPLYISPLIFQVLQRLKYTCRQRVNDRWLALRPVQWTERHPDSSESTMVRTLRRYTKLAVWLLGSRRQKTKSQPPFPKSQCLIAQIGWTVLCLSIEIVFVLLHVLFIL